MVFWGKNGPKHDTMKVKNQKSYFNNKLQQVTELQEES